MRIPDADVTAAPFAYPVINRQWAGVLIGLCQKMQYRRAWEGTEAEQDAALEQLEELIARLMTDTPTGAAMPIGTVFPYFGILPTNALECDFTLYDKVDYPALYDALDPSLQVDADHFRVPPNPYWNSGITKLYSASSVYAGTSPSNLDDANLTSYWGSNTVSPAWVEINFNQPLEVSGYTLNVGGQPSNFRPKDWKLQVYSNDAWVDLDTQAGVLMNANTDYHYSFSAVTGLRYRLYITAAQGASQPFLATFKLDHSDNSWKYGIVASEA